MQCVAVCCSVLQRVAVCYIAFQCVAVCHISTPSLMTTIVGVDVSAWVYVCTHAFPVVDHL